jgi:carbonic anhydrase
MKKAFSVILAGLFLAVSPVGSLALASGTNNHHSAASALKELKSGNQRFVENHQTHPNQDKALRDKLSESGQTPMAAILSCSDSRVPAELLFDQGFGDLFVIRVAGNVPGEDEMGSIEYAVEHLGVPLVVVLGHTKCGAVSAAVQGANEPGALGQLLTRLTDAVKSVETLPDEAKAPAAVKANVELGVKALAAKSPVLAKSVKEGRVKIMGAVYNLEDGRVVFD